MTKANRAASQESARACQDLTDLAAELKSSVNRFHT